MEFKSSSLDWALEHIRRFGDTDIFPVPFEYEAIASAWKAKGGPREWMEKQDPLSWTCRPHRRCLVPKHRFGFRISTQLDPLDAIAFTSLVCDLGKDIERTRLPVSREIVHSYRFGPLADGRMYETKPNWNTFRSRSMDLVRAGSYSHVVVADIADFFPKIYSHPLENELIECTAQRKSTAKAILGMLKQWNQTISYGLPVGPAASRLLAELALTIVDKAMVDKGAVYCRFSDDFRIFCADFREAHERLAFLAQVLFESLGVTLQQHKTEILSEPEFRRTLASPQRQARSRLSQQFEAILSALGIDDPYRNIDYEHLSPTLKQQVDALNLGQVLEEQIDLGKDLDIKISSFVLRRLTQLRDDAYVDVVLDNFDTFYPVFPDAVSYIACLDGLHGNKRRKIGQKLLDALEHTVSGHLEFHRCWLLNVFAESDRWDNEALLAQLESKWQDVFTRRELILARGRAGHAQWFKMHKLNVENLGPWERRAFLYAASCLPGDEAKHWWDGLRKGGSLDPIDRAIVGYAKNHPIR